MNKRSRTGKMFLPWQEKLVKFQSTLLRQSNYEWQSPGDRCCSHARQQHCTSIVTTNTALARDDYAQIHTSKSAGVSSLHNSNALADRIGKSARTETTATERYPTAVQMQCSVPRTRWRIRRQSRRRYANCANAKGNAGLSGTLICSRMWPDETVISEAHLIPASIALHRPLATTCRTRCCHVAENNSGARAHNTFAGRRQTVTSDHDTMQHGHQRRRPPSAAGCDTNAGKNAWTMTFGTFIC